MSKNQLATRQASATTGRIKKPRLQVCISEPLCEQVSALAAERGSSVSATCAWIIERHFEANPVEYRSERDRLDDEAWKHPDNTELNNDSPDLGEMQKMFELFKAAKAAGVL